MCELELAEKGEKGLENCSFCNCCRETLIRARILGSPERSDRDRKSGGEGKRVDLGGRRISKKKTIKSVHRCTSP